MSSLPVIPPSQLGSYAGLRPTEQTVLRQWLAKHEREYDRFQYNVRTGTGTDPGPDVEEAIRRGWIQSTQLRIDVVGWQGQQATLIEVKDRATPGAIGQLAVYSHHWRIDNPSLPVPKLLVIAFSAVAGVPEAMTAQGIAFEIVLPS